jgi:hypothetical protein
LTVLVAVKRLYDRQVPKKVPARSKAKYIKLRREGWPQSQAATEVGISKSTAHRFDYGLTGGMFADWGAHPWGAV